MTSLKSVLWKWFGKTCIRLGFTGVLVSLFQRVIESVDDSVELVSKDVPTLLALNPDRFRGDLDILARTGRFRVLRFPFKWQTRLLTLFWPANLLSSFHRFAYWEAEEPEIRKTQAQLRVFLREFLPLLFERLGVDAVVGAALHYAQDYDIGAISSDLGVPYIVLHRENLFVSADAWTAPFKERCEALRPFVGDRIIVHNDAVRSFLIKEGLGDAESVYALGCLRMDKFVRQVEEKFHESTSASRCVEAHVVLFSFSPKSGIPFHQHFSGRGNTKGFFKLFDDVHCAIASLASRHPDMTFTIKTKWGGNWIDAVRRSLAEDGFDPDEMHNLTVTADANPQELIITADAVVGFGSTTVLEAGITGVPVVVPYFAEACQPEYQGNIYFREQLGAFDLARSRRELEDMIMRAVSEGRVSAERLRERRQLFEVWVSALDGTATRKYADVIEAAIDEAHSSGETVADVSGDDAFHSVPCM